MNSHQERRIEHAEDEMIEQSLEITGGYTNGRRCHCGLPIQIWLDGEKDSSQNACLCPPAYYGENCQNQNQRVSLTVQFRTYSDSRRTLFTILVSLIAADDEERRIESYQQHTYLYLQHGSTKYDIYSLYPTRPRDPHKNYSVHIDVYEKVSLTYRTSFFIPVPHAFLPVNRIALLLSIPSQSQRQESCSDSSCVNGQCLRYIADRAQRTFCQCEQGWYGKFCHLPHRSLCASDSRHVGVSATNRSVCACPINRWGSRCLLRNDVCQSSPNEKCLHGGRCVPDDQQLIHSDKFICICPKGYDGKRCERAVTRLILSFQSGIDLPQAIMVHFIFVSGNYTNLITNGSTIETVSLHQTTTTVHWPDEFHIAFARLFNDYYLIHVQNKYNQTATIVRTIRSSDRCPHLSEVLDGTIARLHLLRRIKHYQRPCQMYAPTLKCFYDASYFCLCYDFDGQRLANCFPFRSDTPQTCLGYSVCENGAECIQDRSTCPKRSLCVCPKCYHGTRCQFDSHLFGLSLDAILGYHIQPHVSFAKQLAVVQTSLVLIVLMSLVGIINGVLSLITFKRDETRKSGCGYYLFGSSVTTLFTMVMFALKFSVLIIAQITSVSNRSFLHAQCYTMDFLLRLGLNMDQYLNACVALERAFTAIQGVKFDKKKSRQMAKYVIIGLLVWTMVSTIPDPIHRRLVADDDDDDGIEKRIWCVVSYSSRVRVYNFAINLIHFSVPFVVNIISSVMIIIMTTRRQTTLHADQPRRKLLWEQIRTHQHLLIAPIVLIILAIPRLILSLISDCMKSTGAVWLPLMGYFISFIPPMLTLVIFVLPSKLYRNEFNKSVKEIQNTIRRLRSQRR